MLLSEKYAKADYNSAVSSAKREGRVEGRAEGRAEGKELNRLESITSLMKTLRLSAEQAMDALQIPEKDWPKYKSRLK